MTLKRKVPYETAVLEIVQILLDPLREVIPEVVDSVYHNLNGGRTPDRAGQALLQGLIAWRDRVADQKTRVEFQEQEQRLTEILSKEIEQNKTIVNLRRKINALEQGIGEQKLQSEFLQKTIQNQNSIISEQHDRLIALLGHSRS